VTDLDPCTVGGHKFMLLCMCKRKCSLNLGLFIAEKYVSESDF
jgi:hypothetical protein